MPTDQLDTGLPGFVVEGKLHHLSPGDKKRIEQHPDVTPREKQGQLTNYPEIVDASLDIAKSTKNTLAYYLGRRTSERNYVPLDLPEIIDTDPSSAVLDDETKLLIDNNVVPDIKPTSNTRFFVEKKILDSQGKIPSKELWSWKGGNKSDSPSQLSPSVKDLGYNQEGANSSVSFLKGQTKGWNENPEKNITGNELFSDKNEGAKKLRETFVNKILSNNRFTPSPPDNELHRASHESSAFTVKKSSSVDGTTSEVEFENSREKSYNPVLNHPKYGSITMGRLAQIGTALSLRGSLELFSSDSKQNPSSGESELAALLPSPNQLGITKIRQGLLEAKSVLDDLTLDEADEDQYININNSSWGTMNNVYDKFSGFSSVGQIVTSIALSLLIGGLLSAIFEWLSRISENDATKQNFDDTKKGDNYLGSYSGQGRFGIPPGMDESRFYKRILKINETIYDMSDSIDKGISIFYGFEGKKDFLDVFSQFALSTLVNSVFASGHNVTISRCIMRGGRSIITAIEKSISVTINPVSVIKNILGVIEAFANSKLVSAFNMFSAIGDAALLAEQVERIQENGNKKVDENFQGHLNSIEDWSLAKTPSLVLNRNLINNNELTIKNLGAPVTPPPTTQKKQETKNGPRISTEDREAFEEKLDAAYVPFYFHDIRTNEIISFNAFLTSLTDGFSVSYDSIEGFGRVEPIKTYKGTQRKIGFEFILVATTNEDFDVMWEKINKLTMLLYPQYTNGRTIDPQNGYKFIQPFSQMIGASPLIRLRLGNLFRSNYSRFSLARLFGAGLEGVQFKLSEEAVKKQQEAKSRNVAAEDELNSQIAAEANKKRNEYLTLDNLKDKLVLIKDRRNIKLQGKAGKVGNFQKYLQTFGTNYSEALNVFFENLKFKVITTQPDRRGNITCELDLDNQPDIEKLGVPYVNIWNDFKDEFGKIKKINFLVPINVTSISDALGIPKGEIANINREAEEKIRNQNNFTESQRAAAETQLGANSPDDFFKPKNNSLIKSFRSAGGHGLAGVIESMDFNWFDQVTWDVDKGRKAPQMCKINISFSPIHDISPGLDKNGINRAPIYQVGKYDMPEDSSIYSIWGGDKS